MGAKTKQRYDVGTDIALIGVWDESRGNEVVRETSMTQRHEILAADAEQGHVFLLRLDGDWGGAIDVYVDSSLEASVRRNMRQLPGECLLSTPTGRAIVGGAEDYRSSEARTTSKSSVISLEPGQYGLKCYMLKSDDGEIPDAPPPAEIEKTVGKKSFAYYESRNRWGTMGFSLFLLFLPITYWFGWIVGLVATLAIVLAFFHLLDWHLKRDANYAESEKAVEATILASREKTLPSFAIELRRLAGDHGIHGGLLDLSDTR